MAETFATPQPTPDPTPGPKLKAAGSQNSSQPQLDGDDDDDCTAGWSTGPFTVAAYFTAPQNQAGAQPWTPPTPVAAGGSVAMNLYAFDQDVYTYPLCNTTSSGDTLTFTWNGGGGTFTVANPTTTATWQAKDAQGNPLAPGDYTITCTVDDMPDNQRNPAIVGTRDDPAKVASITIKVFKLDANIYNGQGATTAVADASEESVGAFTVANLNDTDGDGVVDNNDTNGVIATAAGRDEVDLMRLEIVKPYANFAGNMVLVHGTGGPAIRLWTTPTKSPGSEVTLTNNQYNISHAMFPATGPYTLYVEATAASSTLRDIVLYVVFGGGQDTVKATAVWVTQTAVMSDTRSPASLFGDANATPPVAPDAVWGDTDATPKAAITGQGGTGLSPISPVYGAKNGIIIQFTVAPSGIGSQPGVQFDIGRQIENKLWTVTGMTGWVEKTNFRTSMPTTDEGVNDDTVDTDESAAPNATNFLYVVDAPGLSTNTDPHDEATSDLAAAYYNAREFVRVSFDNARPTGNTTSGIGSRCSDKYAWHAKVRIQNSYANPPKWLRSTGAGTNEVGPGALTIGTTP